MCKPQLTGAESGFGVGFQVGKFRGHKSIGHTGAVYGYTASLAFLPDLKIGAVLLSNEDLAVGPLSRLTNVALGRLIEAKLGESVPSKPIALQVPPQELAPLTGEFESPNYWAKIELSDNGLIGNISGQKITLTAVEKLRFLAEGRLFDSVPVQFDRDATGKIISFTALSQKFARVDPDDHADAPPLWSQYVGATAPSSSPWSSACVARTSTPQSRTSWIIGLFRSAATSSYARPACIARSTWSFWPGRMTRFTV